MDDVEDLLPPAAEDGAVVTLDALDAEEAEEAREAARAAAAATAAMVVTQLRAHRGHSGVQLECLQRLAPLLSAPAAADAWRSALEMLQVFTGLGDRGEGGRRAAGADSTTTSAVAAAASGPPPEDGVFELVLALQQYGADARVAMYGCLALGTLFLRLAEPLPAETAATTTDGEEGASPPMPAAARCGAAGLLPFAPHAVGTALALMEAQSENPGVQGYTLHALHGALSCRSASGEAGDEDAGLEEAVAARLRLARLAVDKRALPTLAKALTRFAKDDFVVACALYCMEDLFDAIGTGPFEDAETRSESSTSAAAAAAAAAAQSDGESASAGAARAALGEAVLAARESDWGVPVLAQTATEGAASAECGQLAARVLVRADALAAQLGVKEQEDGGESQQSARGEAASAAAASMAAANATVMPTHTPKVIKATKAPVPKRAGGAARPPITASLVEW